MSADTNNPIEDPSTEYGPEPMTPEEREATVVVVSRMTVPQKIEAALKGTREMRSILVRDPNRIVA